MRNERGDGLTDLTAAFLIGAGLGVAATILLRRPDEPVPRRRRLIRRLASRQPLYRDLRTILATLSNR